MAKTVTQAPEGPTSSGWGFTGMPETRKLSRKAARETEIPWTRGPQTRWEKFKRATVG